MEWSLTILLLCFLTNKTLSTISPSNYKQRKDNKDRKINEDKRGIDQSVLERGLVVEDPKTVDILQYSALYFTDTKLRNFKGEVLGYVTPWNRDGYEVVKTFHGKLTVVSPVWLTLPNGSDKKFNIATHDVQESWLNKIRAANDNNHTVRITPRLLFENWSPEDIMNLHNNHDRKAQLISALAKTAQKFKLQGYVLEIWTGFVYSGVEKKIVVNLVKSLCKGLKEKNLEVILVIPPSRSSNVDVFSQEDFDLLSSVVDYFSLMTYDFSSIQRPGPNSPLKWARDCIEKLVPSNNDPRRKKILMGLNFYGYSFNAQGGNAVVGSEYLKLVKSFHGKIKWDQGSKEHFFELKTKSGSSFVFYPTLYSLQHRIDLAKEMGVGISIWELGQGLNYFYDLL